MFNISVIAKKQINSKRFSAKQIWLTLKEAGSRWWEKDPFRESATIAYYAIFSIPGLLAIIVSIAAFFFGKEAIKGEISHQVSEAMSKEAAKQIEIIIAQAFKSKTSVLASIIGIITMLFGATGVLVQFQKSLNNIWEVKVDPHKKQWIQTIKSRLFSLGIIAVIGFLMLTSMVITIAISALSKWINQAYPETLSYLMEGINMLVSLIMVTILFAIMFKVLPNAKIKWKHVMSGGFLTAILFTIGKFVLGYYFGKSDPASAYGAAGSVILILLWVSYSSMIVFLGAEFTKAFVVLAGEKIIPKDNAVYVPGLNEAVVKTNSSETNEITSKRNTSNDANPAYIKTLSAPPVIQSPSRENSYKKWLRLLVCAWPLLSLFSYTVPFILKAIVNRNLHRRGAGQIGSLRLSMIHFSCEIKKYHFEKVDLNSAETLDCSIKLVRLSFNPRALWDGMLICDTAIAEPKMLFTNNIKGNDKDKDEDKNPLTFANRFHVPIPFIVNTLSISNGKFTFRNTAITPAVNIEVDNIRVDASYLSIIRSTAPLPTRVTLKAHLYDGILTIHLKSDISKHFPSFDMDAEVIGIDMTKMNTLFKAYGKFDVNAGKLGIYAEVAAKKGKYKGYIKPIIHNLDITDKNENQNFLNKMWEDAIGATAAIFKNQHKDQLATKIPIEGSYKPDIDIWHAIIETLVNAFIQALRPSIDHEININSVEEAMLKQKCLIDNT